MIAEKRRLLFLFPSVDDCNSCMSIWKLSCWQLLQFHRTFQHVVVLLS